jgi:hypothetical protein
LNLARAAYDGTVSKPSKPAANKGALHTHGLFLFQFLHDLFVVRLRTWKGQAAPQQQKEARAFLEN